MCVCERERVCVADVSSHTGIHRGVCTPRGERRRSCCQGSSESAAHTYPSRICAAALSSQTTTPECLCVCVVCMLVGCGCGCNVSARVCHGVGQVRSSWRMETCSAAAAAAVANFAAVAIVAGFVAGACRSGGQVRNSRTAPAVAGICFHALSC